MTHPAWLLSIVVAWPLGAVAQDFPSAGEGFARGFERGAVIRRNREAANESRQRTELLEIEQRILCEEASELSWLRRLDAFNAVKDLLEGEQLKAEQSSLLEAYERYRTELESCRSG